MTTKYRKSLRLLVPCLLLCLTSCGLSRFPVEGKVTLNGEALKEGSVAFYPDEAKGNTSPYTARAQIAADGSYALYTDGAEGAPVGAYKVTVIAEALADSTEPLKTRLLVPAKYARPDTTPLTIVVIADPAEHAYDLPLK